MLHCWSIHHWSYSGCLKRRINRIINGAPIYNLVKCFCMVLWPRRTISWNNILKRHFIHRNPPDCSFVALWKLCGSTVCVSLKPVLYFQQKNKDKCLFHHVTLTGYPPTHSYACEHTHTHKQHNEKHGKLCQVGPATTYKPHVYADILCFWMTVMGLCWHVIAAVSRMSQRKRKAGMR